ncbi:MAG: DUF1080 domain-containing protein [Planctomycetes bacterium]|nr:DUF1080 domain-containing protein [Planctomycetota bacterium]
MKKGLFSAWLLGCVALVSSGAFAADGFIPLFNGKDLSGWTTVGTAGSFEVKDGMIRTTGAHPYPSWLRSNKRYENFILRFSFRTEKRWHEGGIVLHAPAHGPASRMGFRIHLRHEPKAYGDHSMGAIYNVAVPLAFPGAPAQKWNRFEVLCNWPTLRVKLNGTLIHDIDMSKEPAWRHRLRTGFIEIENVCNSAGLYKDIEIKPLPGKIAWTPLFTAPGSLVTTGGAKWTYDAATQAFTAAGSTSMAYTKQEFQPPYELQVWVKVVAPNGNGGVMFNVPKGKKYGVEIQCFNVPGATNPTGSLYGISYARKVITRDGQWFLIQLFNEGKHAVVYVNGEKLSETDALRPPYKGRIGFQQHTPNGKIIYRGARIRPLRPGRVFADGDRRAGKPQRRSPNASPTR